VRYEIGPTITRRDARKNKPTTMARHLNLALLICDTPLPAVQAAHGTYLDIFRTHLQKSLESALENKGQPVDSVQFTLDGYDVVKGVYPDDAKLDTYDGIVITGSGKLQFHWLVVQDDLL
jgi:hypothetical protein